jgi:hypothetical protein
LTGLAGVKCLRTQVVLLIHESRNEALEDLAFAINVLVTAMIQTINKKSEKCSFI